MALGPSAFAGMDEMRSAPQHVLCLALDASAERLRSLSVRFLAAHSELALPDNALVTNTWKPDDRGWQELSDLLISSPHMRVLVIDNLAALRRREGMKREEQMCYNRKRRSNEESNDTPISTDART
ncbi:hypothetical protein [Ktedonobacter racemifer]|uniref:Uncharacterized protein n=1 Tax=Ktedonobacter racemifer DSM 44963 TaxID=485913 RepID=D6U515_KTERA|nr:hypothetical protein [Ktedonobacter racemifer]EFH81595.1 hypothetical protein Krac_2328 [Ktedonobacter racemifer DSM 44963]